MLLSDRNASSRLASENPGTGKSKIHPANKFKMTNFRRSRGQLHINNLAESPTNDQPRSSLSFRNPPEESKLKLKLMNLTQKNTAKETSEGVQELIKHVSEFIGKKNPFKENASTGRKDKNEPRHSITRPYSYKDAEARRSSRASHTSPNGDRKSNKTFQSGIDKSSRDPTPAETSELETRSYTKSSSYKIGQTRKHTVPISGVQPPSVEEKKENRERLEDGDKRPKYSYKSYRRIPSKENMEKNHSHTEGRRTEPEVSPRYSTTKRQKPSEIPLRKNRKDLAKRLKPLPSTVTLKTVEGIKVHQNSNTTINLTAQRETTKVTETDQETLKLSSSFEMLTNEPFIDSDKTKSDAHTREDIQPSGTTKNSNTPDDNSHLSNKSRKLDLEQVRSSTFTVLRTLSHTLHRLESIHQQNVGIKENGLAGEKGLGSKSSMLKMLTPKSSFNLLKSKGSKKNLGSRLSSKGNKPVLKSKTKKSKTELGSNLTPCIRESIKTVSRGSDMKKFGYGVSSLNKMSPSKNPNLEREKLNSRTKTMTKASGSRWKADGAGFSGMKAPTSEVSPLKNQGDVEMDTSSNEKLLFSRSEINYSDKIREELQRDTSPERPVSANMSPTTGRPRGDFNSFHEDENLSTDTTSRGSSYLSKVSTPHQQTLEEPQALTTSIERKKSYSIILEEPLNSKPNYPESGEQHTTKRPETFRVESRAKPRDQTRVKKPKISAKDLRIKGVPANLPEVKSEESDLDKVKLKITIDLNSKEKLSGQNKIEENDYLKKNVCSFNWLFMNYKKYGHEEQTNAMADEDQEDGATSEEVNEEAMQPEDTFVENVNYSSAVSTETVTSDERQLKNVPDAKRRPRPKYKTPVLNSKTMAKKMKTNSETGDRWLCTSKGHFNSAIDFQDKMTKSKPDTKLRSGLTRSFNRDTNICSERRDHFDDVNFVKLRRRNSEPYSFRGFIWRHQDTVPTRGNKASMSSLTSSLKHLNTDDLEDFIFWESVPPRVTSCWEMSLYHFKRPWSVLSCSVFKDNRLSNTPGLILENIRNGNSTNRWPMLRETERVSNSFDVEPSITQKNIDISNWLAALNFQNPPSTSSDTIREGGCAPQTVVTNHDFKSPIMQKRRKVFPGLKFSENNENKTCMDSDKFNSDGAEMGLMELIRRKSGGFVTAEQYFNSRRQSNSSMETSTQEKIIESSSDIKLKSHLEVLENHKLEMERINYSRPRILREEKMVQVAFEDFFPTPSQSGASLMTNPSSSSQIHEALTPQESRSMVLTKASRGEPEVITTNFWKYLFLITLFVLVSYYVSRNRHVCQV